ncbi:MAG: DUF4212 domain-containing protein [Hyphomicrobiales bacterium]|nr:DUF4212 domain-containing protein [Hyphomicrobiales bacterium]
MILDDEQRRAQIFRAGWLTAAAFLLIMLLVLTAPIWATTLQPYRFLRFDLGFFIVAHGMIVVLIGTVYWFNQNQEQIDREFNAPGLA